MVCACYHGNMWLYKLLTELKQAYNMMETVSNQ